MSRDDRELREAMRRWIAACDALDAADAADYAATIDLAEAASLARLRVHGALVAAGWRPPQQAPAREDSHT